MPIEMGRFRGIQALAASQCLNSLVDEFQLSMVGRRQSKRRRGGRRPFVEGFLRE
jgi:hypothetical protein